MKKIAIITAMQNEYDAVYSLYNFKGNNQQSTVIIDDKEIILIKSGIGKVHAAIATERACRLGADLVINTGLAGGIDDSLNRGDIVLAKKVCYHDVWCGKPNANGQVQDMPLFYEAPEKTVKQILSKATDFKCGLTVTGDQFLTDVTRLKEIKKEFPKALAVDMESAAVAQTCLINNIPYISLRIISDVVGKPEQEEQFAKFFEEVPNKAADMLDRTIKSI